MFLKKIKRKEKTDRKTRSKESIGVSQSSTVATRLSLMLTVGMLGHLSRDP